MSYLARVLFFLIMTASLVMPPTSAPAKGLTDSLVECATAGLPPGKSFNVAPGQVAKLQHDGATLDVAADAVAAPLALSVTSLCQQALPALDQGMTNVTQGKRHGYRFLPHMKFRGNLRVSVPYDKTLIPPGLTEQDIKTFYFDEQAGSWKELERVAVNTQEKTVVSLTDHFTDMINATVTVPDHPQTLSYNPTSIKDIKAADPGAGISLIDAPEANSMGDARLSYPIEVPPGRNGVQPQLVVSYNSSSTSSWLGTGWDLQVPAISIDTRWGVPRYDGDKETETYLMGGEQLTPVAHRDALQDRSADKIFHTRVEGAFQKIIRHGSSPTTYWWEVIDKSGTHYFYGGDPAANSLATDSVLTNPRADTGADPPTARHIFRWMLRSVRDPNGNTIRYRYDTVSGTSSGEPWRQIYLRSIRYTGTDNADGPYEIVFNRESGRPDVSVDARPGFKTVLTDRLATIDVRLIGAPNPLIRRYSFSYVTGQFKKSLLSRVTQYGEDGVSVFNEHSFEYFDEVATSAPTVLNGFRSTPGFDGATTVSGDGLLFDQESTAFGGDASKNDQAHFYGGIAVGAAKEVSAGLKVGAEFGDSTTKLILLDINGDGLSDQVYQSGNRFYFRPNTGGSQAAPNFGAAVELSSLTKIGHESSQTFTVGVQGFAMGISGMADKSFVRTRGDAFMSDVNGDLLPDLVLGGSVYFNHLEAGVPTFRTTSPTPLTTGAASNTDGMVQDPEAGRDEMEEAYHLVDPLRRWIAPYSGTVNITGAVKLLSAPPADYQTADGVRVAIQHNASEIWSTTIDDPNDLSARAISGLDAMQVQAGDRLYFRINSLNDGAFDAVEFNPTITYTDGDSAAVDENAMPLFSYNAADDFAFGGKTIPFTAPFTGTATLSGSFEKPAPTTDDLTLEVIKGGTVVHQQTFAPDQTGTFPVSVDLTTVAREELRLRIAVDSRVDLSGVQFLPKLSYTTIDGQPVPTQPNGESAVVFNPPIAAQIYPRNASTTPYQPLVAPHDGTIRVEQSIAISPSLPSDYTTHVTLAVKRDGQRLAKQRIEIRNGAIVGSAALFARFDVAAGDVLYFVADAATPSTNDESAPDILGALSIGQPQVFYETDSGDEEVPGVQSDIHLGAAITEAFGGGFRSWWYGQYSGRVPSASINESRLRLPEDEDDDVAEDFVQMVPLVNQNPQAAPLAGVAYWRASDDECWITGSAMSASRLMVNVLEFDDGSAFGGARGTVRYGGAENTAGQISVLGFGAGVSDGTNWSDIDFLDFNGDRYPDVVGGGQVQTTLPNGALDDDRLPVGGFSRVRESESTSFNVSLGATTSRQITNSRGKLQGMTSEQAAYNLSAGVSGSRGTFDTRWDLIDINGDSLPDYVRNSSAGLEVRLNLGYRFGAPEIWSASGTVRAEKSASVGLNAGLGATLPAYSFGGGFANTLSTTGAEHDLVDVNGDGLTDIVTKQLDDRIDRISSSTTGLAVRFNTGDSFTEPYAYNGTLPRPLRGNATVSRNLGVHFTIAIPIPFTPISIILNPGYYHGESLGGLDVSLSDFDGDGYADHIYSDTSGNVEVNLNRHGRTNLIKSVRRPLGSIIALDYVRSGSTPDQPGNRWVLSRTAVNDGFAGDGVDQQVTTYSYQDGKYDRAEREFYGFRTVTEQHRDASQNDALYRSIVRSYLNSSFYEKGLLESEQLLDDQGRKFTETVNTYDVVTVPDGAEVPGLADFTATRFPRLIRTDQRFYEGNATPGKTTYTTQQYDALGNVTQFFDAGDLGAEDDVEATIEHSTCAGSYIVGVAVKIVVKGNGTVMRRREATIDCANGNITQVREYLANGDAAVTDLAYFPNGNLRQVTDPANSSGQRYQLTYEYDAVVQTHVTRITDSFGYSSTSAHNFKYGAVEANTDINHNQTGYVYDIFGRIQSITGPYDQGTGTPTIRFEYHPEAAVPWALTRHLDTFRSQTDTINTVLFTDGLKRVLQTKKDGAIHTGVATTPQDVMLVSGRVRYDFLGRTVEQFYPTTEPLGTPGTFNTTFDSIQPTRMTYDVLDRTTSTTLPDNTATTTAYGFGLDRTGTTQFQTTVTDANGIQKQTYRNVGDLVTGLQETNTLPDGTDQIIWTSYTYDPLDQLVEVTDDQNHRTTIAYDQLGRRTVIDSPDAGKTETIYDLASNPIAKITANLRAENKQISYSYDFNRLTNITYPNFSGNNVSYSYGDPGAADNRAGRITVVTDESGQEERFYGKLGEIVKEIKTVASDTQGGSQNSPEVYTTQYTYDTFGRLQRMIYPDGELLTYSYDSGGQVRHAIGQKAGHSYEYVKRLEYDKFEQRAFMQSGNNIRTQYSYRPDNRRLQTLKAGTGNGNLFQNLVYNYDNVGNLLSLANDVPVPPASQFGGPTVQTFHYDDLYRLVGAEGSYRFMPDKTNQYSLSLSYDTIHNIHSKQQAHEIVQPSGTPIRQHKTSYDWTYSYDGSQPHAPTHVGERTYSYDANGNQTSWTHDQNGTRRTIVWDEENRIQSVFDNGHEKTYKYDDAGERVIKRGPQGETAYVNQYFTMRNREVGTKHVYVGSTRMVSKMMKQDKPGGNPGGQNPFEKDQYFYHPDHLGSSNYITDANGKLYEHLEYFPFGETWVEESSNTQRTPYLFTGKELDEETGLYYYGARYYDPRTSVWQSPDPMLAAYLDDDAPAFGVRVPQNLALYSYSWNNPVIYRDPDGQVVNLIAGAIGSAVGAVAGSAIYAGVSLYRGEEITGKGLLGAAAGGAVSGGLAGVTMGASVVAQAGIAGTVGVAGAAGVAGGVTNRAIVTDGDVAQTFDPKSIGQDFAFGAAGGMAGKALTVAAQRVIGPSSSFATLRPGPHAGRNIPATGPRVTRAQGRQMTSIGQCHTCGTRTSGYSKGTFVGDHQPSTNLIVRGGNQRLYPHCRSCSGRQGHQVRRQNEIWRTQQQVGISAGTGAATGGSNASEK